MTPLQRDGSGALRKKPDAEHIRKFMLGLADKLQWHARDHRRLWPRHAYRFDHITSVAAILRAGRIYCRRQANSLKVLQHDAADPEIISQSTHAHGYVRLYFGPRTPTQSVIEGIRADHAIGAHGAHCPVPVFLVFDGPELLGTEGVSFSNGNLAAREHRIGSDYRFLAGIPWDMVYHRGPLPLDQRSAIKFHRHAEILVEDELDLSLLQEVVCRTGPERATLLDLLGPRAASWDEIIRVARPGEDIFERTHYHIDDVHLDEDKISVRARYKRIGPFTVGFLVTDPTTEKVIKEGGPRVDELGSFSISLPAPYNRVHLQIVINGHLAYSGLLVGQRLLGAQTLFS